MAAAKLVFSNYGFLCHGCNLSIKLSELLPKWADIMLPSVRLVRVGFESRGPILAARKIEILPISSVATSAVPGESLVERDPTYVAVTLAVPYFDDSQSAEQRSLDEDDWITAAKDAYRSKHPDQLVVFA